MIFNKENFSILLVVFCSLNIICQLIYYLLFSNPLLGFSIMGLFAGLFNLKQKIIDFVKKVFNDKVDELKKKTKDYINSFIPNFPKFSNFKTLVMRNNGGEIQFDVIMEEEEDDDFIVVKKKEEVAENFTVVDVDDF